MLSWLRRLGRAGDPDARINDADWSRVVERVPWIAALDPERRKRARSHALAFLRSKSISGAADFEPEPWQRHALAALAVLPVLERGMDWLKGWHELIVYPGQFGLRRHHHDEATGIVSEWDDELAGEAWDRGPVVLSWADIEADLAEPDQGFCVAVHEIAHKLDALDGSMDGTPPLTGESRRIWISDFQQAYDGLLAELEAGREVAIDEYAAESPDEFFAVATEYHFSAPDVLEEAMPKVAAHLRALYGKPPFAA